MKVIISRTQQDSFQTLGELTVSDIDNGENTFTCKTLELPWLNNQKNISCIPLGRYEAGKRNSEKYGDHFHILNVPDRSYILIHAGNYRKDTEGCVLVGREHIDIDGDGHKDVTSSKATMADLNRLLPSEFIIDIVG